MSNVPVFVGLDYHQDSIQVCVLNQKGDVLLNRSAGNDCDELGRIVGRLGVVQRVGIEACCGAADLGEELVKKLGWNVSLGHPAYVARMKSSPDKSDYSDGRLLADLTRVGYLPLVWLAPASVRELRQLVNHRQRCVDHARSLKLRVGAILREQRVKIDKSRGGRWSKSWCASVRDNDLLSPQARWIVNDLLDDIAHSVKKIAAVEARLREATADDRVVRRLLTQAGIGEVTAWVLRAWVGDFSRFKTAKQLARYCGMSPCNASSGTRVADAGLIDGCNKMLRTTPRAGGAPADPHDGSMGRAGRVVEGTRQEALRDRRRRRQSLGAQPASRDEGSDEERQRRFDEGVRVDEGVSEDSMKDQAARVRQRSVRRNGSSRLPQAHGSAFVRDDELVAYMGVQHRSTRDRAVVTDFSEHPTWASRPGALG